MRVGFRVKLRTKELRDEMAVTDTPADACLRDRLRAALDEAEHTDPHGVPAATLRLVNCALRDRDVAARSKGDCAGCAEEGVREVLQTMADQRRQSAAEYDEAGRIADAEREREELAVIEAFLPKPLEGQDLQSAVTGVVEELDASRLADVGRCMSALKARYPGRIDPAKAGRVVRAALE